MSRKENVLQKHHCYVFQAFGTSAAFALPLNRILGIIYIFFKSDGLFLLSFLLCAF